MGIVKRWTGVAWVDATVRDRVDGAWTPATTIVRSGGVWQTGTTPPPVTFNIGETAVLGITDSGNGNLVLAQDVTLTQSATIQSLSFRVTGAAGQLRLGIYDATGPGGGPGALKAQTAVFTPVAGWNTQPVVTQVALAAGTYWLSHHPSSSSLTYPHGGGGNFRYFNQSFGAFPATFSTSPSGGAGHWSMYATFTASAPPPPDTVPPSAPTSFAGVPSASSVALSWQAATDNVGVTGYAVTRNGVAVASVTGLSYNDTGLAASTTYAYTVRATDAVGNQSAAATVSVTTTAVIPPPGGLTLRAIDGGPTYYADHGFTYAAAAGWDDPSFFPIGLWLAPMNSQAQADRWKDLNLTAAFLMTANSSLSLLRSNGFSAILQADELSQFGALGAETVGILPIDEPSTIAQLTSPISAMPNSVQDGRFWWLNLTHNPILFGDIGGQPTGQVLSMPITTPNGTSRHIDVASTDLYWFAGAEAPVWVSNGGQLLNLGRNATASEMSHGQNYGYMVDQLRSKMTTYPAPMFQFVENGGPYNENTSASNYITSPELNAAVWGSIIHGARGICYFNHTFAGPAQSQDNFGSSYYQTVQAGQTTSIYAQAKATNALVKQLAPVINSPFVTNLVTVSPAPGLFAGVDVMAKSHASGLHVFALNRSPNATNAAFTLNGIASGSVTVVNENRTLPISGGQFLDGFASKDTVHIYRIDTGTPPPPPVDTVAPGVPTNLQETHTASSVTLTWGAATDNVGVTGYVVTRDGIQIATRTGLTYTDGGRSSSTTYTYTVVAVDAAGNRSAAVSRSATTSATTPPPTGLPALWNASPPAGVCLAPTGTSVGSGFDAGPLVRTEVWDHFDGPAGSSPDSRLWLEDTINQGGTQTYDPARCFLDGNGNVALEAISSGGYRSGRFTSRTKFNMMYGWLAARIKFANSTGGAGRSWFPAFWTLHVNYDTGVYGEVDIMEFFGDTTQYSTHIYPGSSGNSLHNEIPAHNGNAAAAFHTYWMQWEPNRIQIGVDDKSVGTWTPSSNGVVNWAGMQSPHYYILNFAVAPSWLPAPVASDFPARMLIDWVWYKPL